MLYCMTTEFVNNVYSWYYNAFDVLHQSYLGFYCVTYVSLHKALEPGSSGWSDFTFSESLKIKKHSICTTRKFCVSSQ